MFHMTSREEPSCKLPMGLLEGCSGLGCSARLVCEGGGRKDKLGRKEHHFMHDWLVLLEQVLANVV